MSKHSQPEPGNRRNFLRRCAALGGSTALFAATPAALARDGERDAPPTAPRERRRGGYRETDHVREYYAKARL